METTIWGSGLILGFYGLGFGGQGSRVLRVSYTIGLGGGRLWRFRV